MQNKGAIRLFAILLALACAYYLMFTWVAAGIENDADQYARNYVASPKVVEASKKAIDKASQDAYIDSTLSARRAVYLDSIKKKPVYDMFITEYTYDEVKDRKLNLGLDLKGGMNVTLEVAVSDIIRSLANNSTDPAFTATLAKTKERQRTSGKDFVTLFGEEYKLNNPGQKLATHFQTIELKDKITFNTSDEEVLKFLRERVEEAIETSENTLRTRIDKFGVTQPTIQRLASSGRILIELPGVTDKARVRKLLQGTANLEFWETYDNKDIAPLLQQANDRLKEIYNPNDSSIVASTDTATSKSFTTKETELASIDSSKEDSLSGKTLLEKLGKTNDSTKSGMSRADSVLQMKKDNPLFSIFRPAFTFNEKNEPVGFSDGPVVGYAAVGDTQQINEFLSNAKIKAIFKPRTKFLWSFKPVDEEGTTLQLIAIDVKDKGGRSPLSGDIIADAVKEFNAEQGGYASVQMTMKADAAMIWKKLSGANVGRSVAIVLDNSVYSYPVIQQELGAVSSITGNFTPQDAEDLANILKAGKLPAPARIVQEAVVGPTLGAEAIQKGFLSTIIALVLVLIFMGFYYSKAGWVADFAMVVNNFFVIGILASLGAVLTLPGIAGIVLTIAMSVDANILIFERVREELALGKSTAVAIKEGYKNAMSSVIDSHITGLLLGIILYVFGTGPIQGFATTLMIGIISSLFCAIFITRLIFDRWLSKGKEIPFSNKFTENAWKKVNINFVGKRKFYYMFSALVITGGVIAYIAKGGFSLGVDFKGGRAYVVRFDEVQTTEEVRSALAASFEEAPEVKTYGESTQQRITTTYMISDPAENADAKVEEKLNEGLNKLGTKYEIMSSEKVGETVSRDIRGKAVWAVLLSCLVMFVFIFIRFKKWQYGLGAVVALFHDVAIVLSVYIMLDGLLPFNLDITQDFIAAILTVMSYSMTDTVVVFDRIREYLTERNKSDLDKEERVRVINYALNSTLSRTINTSLTIFFVLFAIFIFGGETIQGFSFALLIGIVIGTYSSICIATPIVIDFENPNNDKKLK